jgi:hypothetical protein
MIVRKPIPTAVPPLQRVRRFIVEDNAGVPASEQSFTSVAEARKFLRTLLDGKRYLDRQGVNWSPCSESFRLLRSLWAFNVLEHLVEACTQHAPCSTDDSAQKGKMTSTSTLPALPALPTFHTKASIARELGLDPRDKVLDEVTPLGEVVIGHKRMPIFSESDIAKIIKAQKENLP